MSRKHNEFLKIKYIYVRNYFKCIYKKMHPQYGLIMSDVSYTLSHSRNPGVVALHYNTPG